MIKLLTLYFWPPITILTSSFLETDNSKNGAMGFYTVHIFGIDLTDAKHQYANGVQLYTATRNLTEKSIKSRSLNLSLPQLSRDQVHRKGRHIPKKNTPSEIIQLFESFVFGGKVFWIWMWCGTHWKDDDRKFKFKFFLS